MSCDLSHCTAPHHIGEAQLSSFPVTDKNPKNRLKDRKTLFGGLPDCSGSKKEEKKKKRKRQNNDG